MRTLTALAPAKLNRFLHIIGRRDDGYHWLQTILHLIDYCDSLHFSLRDDTQIILMGYKDKAAMGKQPDDLFGYRNLVLQAARLLQRLQAKPLGVDITLHKKIPVCAGLGGGSSDAAATLWALNQLWRLHLPLPELKRLSLQLGTDVPFFVCGHSAWAEGIGEQLTALVLPSSYFLVLVPAVNVSTVEIFCDKQLTRDTAHSKITLSLLHKGHNDCESVVTRRYPEIAAALAWLRQFNALARITGTGSCVFAAFDKEEQAWRVAQQVPESWDYFIARGMNRSYNAGLQ